MRYLKRSVLLIPLLLYAHVSAAQELKSEDVYKRVIPSVVVLKVDCKSGPAVLGTAFMAFRDGLAVTAWHVVKNASHVIAKFQDGEEFEASGLVDKDEKRDLALIRVKVAGRPLLAIADGDPDVGAKAYVVGSPKGLDFTISDGLISQVRTIEGVKEYQFSCPVSPGNSGGPLVNAKGEVVGVVSWQVRDGQNLSFAIPISYARGLDASLPTRPWEDVKADQPQAETGSPSSITDERLAESLVDMGEALIVVALVNDDIVRRKGGFKAGVPPYVYTIQRRLAFEAGDLEKARCADANRELLRTRLAAAARADATSLELMTQAIRAAQQAGGWTPSANDLYSRALSAVQDVVAGQRGAVDYAKLGKAFASRLPELVRQGLGLSPDPSGFRIDVFPWPRNDVALAVIPKDGLAYKLGLRPGDVLAAADGKNVTTLTEFKLAVKGARGKSLRVAVLRNGKRVEWTTRIPADLPPAATPPVPTPKE